MHTRSTVKRLLIFIVLIVVVLRLAAPIAIENYLNEQILADMGQYTGRIEDVDLALLRGAAQFDDLRVRKVSGNTRVDFITIPTIETGLSWRALLKGGIYGYVIFERPEVNFVDATLPEDQQTGEDLDLPKRFDELFPLTLHEIEIRQGTVYFRNFDSEPPVDLRAADVNVLISNLTNVEGEDGERVATIEANARLFDQSPLAVKASFDPFERDDFIFAGEVDIKDLTSINDFAQAYANLDFKSGEGELVMELEANDGELTGYAKPFFENIEVFSWKQDVENKDTNVFQVLWEGLAELTQKILSNPKTDKLATRIEIDGNIDDAEVSTWGAVWGVVRNAFVEALSANFEELTPFTDSDTTEEESEGTGG